MKLLSLALHLIAGALFAAAPAQARELKDATFGFNLEIPDGYNPLKIDPSQKDTIHMFVDREPKPDDPARVIQLQRLRGVIDPGAKLKASELPVVEGVTMTIREFTWKGVELEAVRQALKFPNGLEYVTFTIQYPLSGEAVQLQVGGAAKDEKEVLLIFQQIAGGFENIRPIHSSDAAGIRKLSKEERMEKLVGGLVRLAILIVVIVFLFRVMKRAFSKRKGELETGESVDNRGS